MRIGINCGHTLTGAGSGAVGIINESEHTRLVGRALTAKLQTAGHKVIDCTVDKSAATEDYLAGVVQMANQQDLDWFISVHFNASGTGQGRGSEVYTYKGRQYPDAINICQNLEKMGFKNRGVKEGSGLYVIKKTKAKAMLIEVCFCDNPEDIRIYEEAGGADAVAQAIFAALTYHLEDAAETQQKEANSTENRIENHNMSRAEFIEFVGKIASRDWQERRIMLPSVVVAQAMKESACGTSELAQNACNLFGIKQNGWTGRVYYKDAIEQNADGSYRKDTSAAWRAYDSWEQSIVDHNDYIATRKIGSQTEPNWVKVIGETDYKKCVYALQGAHYPYATSLTYAESLIRDYIDKENLTRFDSVPDHVHEQGYHVRFKTCRTLQEAQELVDKLSEYGIEAEIATSQ